jgi:hypothetical protein
VRRNDRTSAIRRELEQRIQSGRCVYCRAPAAPGRPLTREHVIPRAKGGRRKDTRIIVPACAACNQRRGCQEIVLFLLARPRRISAFLDYLGTLSPDTVRQIDLRVFAELFAAVWLLGDSATWGPGWRERLRHLCSGRRLHRRRYAARRIVATVGGRLERIRERAGGWEGPTCLLPASLEAALPAQHDPSLPRAVATLVGALSLVWEVPAERVMEELERERTAQRREQAAHLHARVPASGEEDDPEEVEGVLPIERARRRRGRRRRTRVDQRGGRGASRRGRSPRGRAA